MLLYVNTKNATILISMVAIYVYQCHIHNGPWPQPIARPVSGSVRFCPPQLKHRWAAADGPVVPPGTFDVSNMGCLTQTYPEMADVESSTYGYVKSSFLDNMDEFTLWIQTYPEMVNHRVNHQLRNSSINIWSSYAGWWLSHPSEKYESQLGLFFPIQYMEK